MLTPKDNNDDEDDGGGNDSYLLLGASNRLLSPSYLNILSLKNLKLILESLRGVLNCCVPRFTLNLHRFSAF